MEGLAAALADAAVADRPAALLVDDQQRGPVRVLGVAVAPAEQRDEGGPEVEALLGQEVLVALGALLVGPALEDVLVDQSLEPRRKDVAGNPEALLELVES